jgi:Ca2+-binding EF-hand superfamily protein
MKSYLIGATAIAVLAAGSAFAQVSPTPQTQSAKHAPFNKAETKADVQAHVQKLFARFDANHDGFITKDEIASAQSQFAAKAQERAKRFDPSRIFDRFDTNHDGQITKAEADAVHAARAAARANQPNDSQRLARGDNMFARFDANKDGVVTRAEFDAAMSTRMARFANAGMHRRFGGHLFEMADTNKDGKVSLAEAQTLALQHFDQADLNHDGKLTPDERRQGRQTMRGMHHPA